jgi:hypothetical protein
MKQALRLSALTLAAAVALLASAGDAQAKQFTVYGVDHSGDKITSKTEKARFSEKLIDGGDRVGKVRFHVKRTRGRVQYLRFRGLYKFHGGKIRVEGKMIRSYYLDTTKAQLKIVLGKGRYHGITGHVSFHEKFGETKHTFRYKLPK